MHRSICASTDLVSDLEGGRLGSEILSRALEQLTGGSHLLSSTSLPTIKRQALTVLRYSVKYDLSRYSVKYDLGQTIQVNFLNPSANGRTDTINLMLQEELC